MSNEPLVEIPTDLTDEEVLRQFLYELVVKLETALGYRTDDIDESVYVKSKTDERLAELLDGLTQLSQDTITANATYSQTNIQDIADNLKAVADKLDALIAVLN